MVASDEGFSVEVIGPTSLLYTEGGTVWDVSTEWLASVSPAMVIYKNDIRPMSGQVTADSLSPTRRDEIVENIRRALRFDGAEIDVM
ncbi:MAG: hypothetical protein NVS1B4_23210 [Gemmatimonadaceae bacterium]